MEEFRKRRYSFATDARSHSARFPALMAIGAPAISLRLFLSGTNKRFK
jgi:hypothetical protein